MKCDNIELKHATCARKQRKDISNGKKPQHHANLKKPYHDQHLHSVVANSPLVTSSWPLVQQSSDPVAEFSNIQCWQHTLITYHYKILNCSFIICWMSQYKNVMYFYFCICLHGPDIFKSSALDGNSDEENKLLPCAWVTKNATVANIFGDLDNLPTYQKTLFNV